MVGMSPTNTQNVEPVSLSEELKEHLERMKDIVTEAIYNLQDVETQIDEIIDGEVI